MVIEFKTETARARFLDPSNGYAETGRELEVRTDPLTRRSSYIFKVGFQRPQKKDLSPLIQKSLDRDCSFCPQMIDHATPKFLPELLPEGRIQVGEARVFPNLIPYAPYSAVVSLSNQHFVALPDFNNELLTDGFTAGQAFLRRVQQYDARAKYFNIGWNYMPFAGGSELHPHLHALADYRPTPYHKELLAASYEYYRNNASNFWVDLITREQELGERYIGNTGTVCWLTSFAPKGRRLDVLAIFQQQASFLDTSEQELKDFTVGLEKVFHYLNDQNMYSFNLSINSETAAGDYFWAQARIIPRLTFGLDVSDCSYHEVLQDFHFGIRSPEDTCLELRQYFNQRR